MKTISKRINEAAESNIIDAMKNALKEEFNAWYEYLIVKEWLAGQDRKEIEEFFEEAAKDELEDHAYWLMKRINQLGGDVENIAMSAGTWDSAKHKREIAKWTKAADGKQVNIIDTLQANILNEEGAIETYEELIKMTEGIDPASNSKLKEILADEQEHLQELKDFLNDMQ